MSKNLIDTGDNVVFAQRYLDEDNPLTEYYGDVGIVVSTTDTEATVDFIAHGLIRVPIQDLELTNSIIETADTPSIEFVDDHELGGMQKAQLIAYKILAQENDHRLNRDINLLLKAQE